MISLWLIEFKSWVGTDYNWTWLAAFVVAGLLSWFGWHWSFPLLPGDASPIYYLLSGLGQALAAIFALVFTISLVAAQLTVRYTYRLLQRAFPWWVILYLLFFALAVIYPFLVLSRNFSLLDVRISLCGAILCIVLLVPYFVTFPRRLGIRQIIHFLAGQARQLNENNLWEDAADKTRSIANIAVSALAYHDYDTFDLAVGFLGSVPIGRSGKLIEVPDVSEKLKSIAFRVLSDRQAAKAPIFALQKIGIVAVHNQVKIDEIWHSTPEQSAISDVGLALSELGIEAAGQKLWAPVAMVHSSLHQIVEEAIDEFRLSEDKWKSSFKDAVSLVIGYSCFVTRAAMEHGLKDTVYGAVNHMILTCSSAEVYGLLDKDAREFVYEILQEFDGREGTKPLTDIFELLTKHESEEACCNIIKFQRGYEIWKGKKEREQQQE